MERAGLISTWVLLVGNPFVALSQFGVTRLVPSSSSSEQQLTAWFVWIFVEFR
jgi:hypothetical protein